MDTNRLVGHGTVGAIPNDDLYHRRLRDFWRGNLLSRTERGRTARVRGRVGRETKDGTPDRTHGAVPEGRPEGSRLGSPYPPEGHVKTPGRDPQPVPTDEEDPRWTEEVWTHHCNITETDPSRAQGTEYTWTRYLGVW